MYSQPCDIWVCLKKGCAIQITSHNHWNGKCSGKTGEKWWYLFPNKPKTFDNLCIWILDEWSLFINLNDSATHLPVFWPIPEWSGHLGIVIFPCQLTYHSSGSIMLRGKAPPESGKLFDHFSPNDWTDVGMGADRIRSEYDMLVRICAYVHMSTSSHLRFLWRCFSENRLHPNIHW